MKITAIAKRLFTILALAIVAVSVPISNAHALSAANGDFETESATSGISGWTKVVSDSKASEGKAVKFYANGTISKTITTPQVSSIKVTAKGNLCQGSPSMTVRIDGNVVSSNISVPATQYSTYSAPLTGVLAGSHKVDISFTNDRYIPRACDRNLIVDKVEFVAANTVIEKAQAKPTATSCIEKAGLEAAKANDSSIDTRWSSCFKDNQWWQVDLGSSTPVERVDVKWETAYASRYLIQGSSDGVNFTTLADVTNNTDKMKSNNFASASVRYIRIYGIKRATGWGFSVWDVKVFGAQGGPVADNTAPSVSLTNISNGQIVIGALPIEATASDNVGVTKVEFYLDSDRSAPVKVDTTAPYCLGGDNGTTCKAWDSKSVSDGPHTLIAGAVDAAGNVGLSPAINFTVANTIPPTPVNVSVINDANASGGKALKFSSNGRSKKTVTTPAVSMVTVTARGDQCNGAPGMTVKIDANTVMASSVSSTSYAKYSAPLTNVGAGSHTVSIEYANDASQAGVCDRNLVVDKVEFTPVPNADTTPPAVSITNPGNGATISGSIPVQASVTDAGGVAKVEFILDGVSMATQTSAPYCLAGSNGTACNNWSSSTVSNTNHVLQVKATDATGNVSTASVSFTVNNPPVASGSLRSVLQYDMAGANGPVNMSEAQVNNYNGSWVIRPQFRSTLPWRTGAQVCADQNTKVSVTCTHMIAWGALYQQSGGNHTKAKVQLANVQIWAQYDNNQWYLLESNPGAPSPAQGNLFPEVWSCNGIVVPGGCSGPATTSQLSDSSTTVYLPQSIGGNSGYLYHFWSGYRYDFRKGPQPVSTLKRVVTLIRARIDPATYDPNAKYVLSAGMDRWGPNGENGWEQAAGRMKIIDKNWRVFSSSTDSMTDPSVPLPGPIDGVLSNSEYR